MLELEFNDALDTVVEPQIALLPQIAFEPQIALLPQMALLPQIAFEPQIALLPQMAFEADTTDTRDDTSQQEMPPRHKSRKKLTNH